MIPYYFGSSGHRLFGCYHPAQGGGASGIVLCHPLGAEYLPAHRTVRLLARRLAERGIHALRFDYYGTGDSDGAQTDASLESHVSDVGVALDELREVSGAASVGLVGIRGGAEVALRAALARGPVLSLVLWDPVLREVEDGSPDVGLPRPAGGAPPVLLVSIRSDPDAYRCVTAALTTHLDDAPQVIHAPAAPYWSDRTPGSAGLPVGAVQEIVEWLAR